MQLQSLESHWFPMELWKYKVLFSRWNQSCPERHLATWTLSQTDDLLMKNTNNACLLRVSWQEWANLIHSFLGFPLSVSFLALSPFPAAYLSVFPAFSSVHHFHPGLEEVEVGSRYRIRCFSASSRHAWQSSWACRGVKQRVTQFRKRRTSCKPVQPLRYTYSHYLSVVLLTCI